MFALRPCDRKDERRCGVSTEAHKRTERLGALCVSLQRGCCPPVRIPPQGEVLQVLSSSFPALAGMRPWLRLDLRCRPNWPAVPPAACASRQPPAQRCWSKMQYSTTVPCSAPPLGMHQCQPAPLGRKTSSVETEFVSGHLSVLPIYLIRQPHIYDKAKN